MDVIASDLKIGKLPIPKQGRVEYRVKHSPGLYLRVSKQGKTWYLRARPPGSDNPTPMRMGPYGDGEQALSLKEARQRAEQWKEDIRGGTDPRDASRRAKHSHFAVIREEFLARGKSAKGRDWKPTTRKAYVSALNHAYLDSWANVPVAQITAAHVEDFVSRLEEEGKWTSARRYLAYLRAFFGWCRSRKQKYIPRSAPLPTEDIELEQPEDAERERLLTRDEIRAYWHATHELPYPWGPFYRCLLLTGQRLNEVATMRRSAVTDGIWTITENKADRVMLLPLSDTVMEELDLLPSHSCFFFSTIPDVPISGFSKAKRKLDIEMQQQLGIDAELEPWVQHDLRRTITTHLRSLGVSREICSKLLNHAEYGVTAKNYDRYEMLDEKKRAATAWARFVLSVANPSNDDTVVPINKKG